MITIIEFSIFRDNIFETGPYVVPGKSQNPTILNHEVVPNCHSLTVFAVDTLWSFTFKLTIVYVLATEKLFL